ncbi:MAG: F0F1 ATP synthase subunit epsilon [Deferribacteres bacterium]|nr:F0F1 ATP synthase subunit epsilon [Deferribacteres bacterium]
MAEKLTLDIVTPYGHVFTGEVDEIVASGSDGELGILPDHIPLITTLKIGMLTYRKGSETAHFFVNWGYAEIGPDRVTIIADSAEKSEDIDVERAKKAMQRAEERLKQIEKFDEGRARAALERSMMRIQVAEKQTAR